MVVSGRLAAVRSAAGGCQGCHRDRAPNGREEQDGDGLCTRHRSESARELETAASILDAGSLGDVKREETATVAASIKRADSFAQVFPEHQFHLWMCCKSGATPKARRTMG
jgi:hypothetical protein